MATLLTRSVQSELEMRSDGRTVEGILMPYQHPAEVFDVVTGEPYREEFVRGVFEGAMKDPRKIEFRFTHAPGFGNVIGWGARLHERDEYLEGSFRLTAADAPKARELLEESHTGLSVGFFPIKSRRHGGVVQRVKAYLEHVAAVTDPAYVGAGVLAVRAGGETTEHDETPDETPRLEEVQAYLERIKNGSPV